MKQGDALEYQPGFVKEKDGGKKDEISCFAFVSLFRLN